MVTSSIILRTANNRSPVNLLKENFFLLLSTDFCLSPQIFHPSCVWLSLLVNLTHGQFGPFSPQTREREKVNKGGKKREKKNLPFVCFSEKKKDRRIWKKRPKNGPVVRFGSSSVKQTDGHFLFRSSSIFICVSLRLSVSCLPQTLLVPHSRGRDLVCRCRIIIISGSRSVFLRLSWEKEQLFSPQCIR